MVNSRMSRRCPVYVPYMPRIFKDTGHLWSIYGASPGDRYIKMRLSTWFLYIDVLPGM
jgi:hypothetical protein